MIDPSSAVFFSFLLALSNWRTGAWPCAKFVPFTRKCLTHLAAGTHSAANPASGYEFCRLVSSWPLFSGILMPSISFFVMCESQDSVVKISSGTWLCEDMIRFNKDGTGGSTSMYMLWNVRLVLVLCALWYAWLYLDMFITSLVSSTKLPLVQISSPRRSSLRIGLSHCRWVECLVAALSQWRHGLLL